MNTSIKSAYFTMDWSHCKADGTRLYPDKPASELIFEETNALAILLANEVVILNEHWWKESWPADAQKTFAIAVNCNETFDRCADAVGVNYEDLQDLYDHYAKDEMYGPIVWCCKKRKQLPLPHILDGIVKSGKWELPEII